MYRLRNFPNFHLQQDPEFFLYLHIQVEFDTFRRGRSSRDIRRPQSTTTKSAMVCKTYSKFSLLEKRRETCRCRIGKLQRNASRRSRGTSRGTVNTLTIMVILHTNVMVPLSRTMQGQDRVTVIQGVGLQVRFLAARSSNTENSQSDGT